MTGPLAAGSSESQEFLDLYRESGFTELSEFRGENIAEPTLEQRFSQCRTETQNALLAGVRELREALKDVPEDYVSEREDIRLVGGQAIDILYFDDELKSAGTQKTLHEFGIHLQAHFAQWKKPTTDTFEGKGPRKRDLEHNANEEWMVKGTNLWLDYRRTKVAQQRENQIAAAAPTVTPPVSTHAPPPQRASAVVRDKAEELANSTPTAAQSPSSEPQRASAVLRDKAKEVASSTPAAAKTPPPKTAHLPPEVAETSLTVKN